MTNTRQQKWSIVAIILVALAASVGGISAAQASTSDMQITAAVRQSVQCFSFARAHGLGKDVLGVYLKRVGKASGTAGAVYHLGYSEGMLDAYGYANASKFPSAGHARLDAAKQLYKLVGCTINVKI